MIIKISTVDCRKDEKRSREWPNKKYEFKLFNLYAFCFQVTDDAHPADSRGVVVVTRALEMKIINVVAWEQCAQIGRFIALWATFHSLWQQ